MTTPQIKFNPVVATYIAIGVAVVYVAWKAFDEWDKFTSKLADSANVYATNAGVAYSNEVYSASNLYYKARRDYSLASGLIDGGQNWPSLYSWESGNIGPVGYTYGSANYPKVTEATVSQTLLSILSGGV